MLLDITGAKQSDKLVCLVGAFLVQICFCVSDGIVFDFSDEPEKMQPGTTIIFSKLDFNADRFEDLRLQEPEPTEREEEQSL